MGFFGYRRRLKILPGLTLNFGKRGISASVGPRGAKMTFGGTRGTRATLGVPGTGISYTVTGGRKAVPGKKPPRGYTLGKVVVCPRCKNMAPYSPEMVGQQLHCPKCEHVFYLGRNVKKAWIPPIVKCKKCGVLIEKSAKVCTVCGAKNRQRSGCCGCALLSVAIFLFIFVLRVLAGIMRAATAP